MSDHVISFPLILVISFCLPSIRCQSCIPVQQCGNDQVLSIDRLSYELNNDSWNNVNNNLCPRTDPTVPQFHIFFQDSSDNKFSSGTFCSIDTLFNSSDVCATSTGELVIHNTASTFLNSNGIVEFGFTSINDSYNTTVTIIYAVTGVFPDGNMIYFEENETFVALNWFIYHPPDHDDPGVKIRYNQQILTDATVKLDESKYKSFQDSSFHCFSASSGDSTTYYSLFVISPTISSEGEYVLIVDTYSATITLVLNPSPLLPSSSYTPASLLISSFSEITSSIISQQDITVTTSSSFTTSLMISSHQLTSSSNSFNYTSDISSTPDSSSIPIILPAILVPSLLLPILLIAVIIIIIPVTILWIRHKRNRCKHRKDTESPSTNNDINFVTKNPAYIQQFSQDPSLYKYHVTSREGGTEVDTNITTEATPPTTIAASVDVLSPSPDSLNNNKPHPPTPAQQVPKRNQLKDTPINNVSQSLPTSFHNKIYNEHSVSSSLMNFEKDLIMKKCINYGPMAKINGRKIADSNIAGEILDGIISNGLTNDPTDSGDNCHLSPEQSVIDTRNNNMPIKQVDGCHGDDDNNSLNMSFEEEEEISDITVPTVPTNIDGGFNSESSTTSVEESSNYSDNNTSCTKLIPNYRT